MWMSLRCVTLVQFCMSQWLFFFITLFGVINCRRILTKNLFWQKNCRPRECESELVFVINEIMFDSYVCYALVPRTNERKVVWARENSLIWGRRAHWFVFIFSNFPESIFLFLYMVHNRFYIFKWCKIDFQ